MLAEEKIPLNPAERDRLVSEIIDQVLGYGPIERFLGDPSVTEIMVNGLDGIYIERDGRLELTDAQFLSDQHILRHPRPDRRDRSVGASTSRRRWSTRGCPTVRA